MLGSGYFTRLVAAVLVAAALGAVIIKPHAGRDALERLAASAPAPAPLAGRACAAGEAPLSGGFAPIEDVLSVSPLGAVTAPGEPLPTPYIRINTRKGDTVFQRRKTTALAPARADITAIERRIDRDTDGKAAAVSWTLHFTVCDRISFYYDRLDDIDESILRRAGGLKRFTELGGPDHLASLTRIRVRPGEVVGSADGFDVGLHDRSAPPAQMARPERYRPNPYQHAAVFDTPPSLVAAITPDQARARCAIDYLPKATQPAWAEKLGDAWGMRRAKGENACRTALVDAPGTAQGAWFTDASHNALTNKVSAIALAPDSIDPERLIFSLHGKLASLTPDMIALAPMLEDERAAAARDFLTFDKGDSARINAAFDAVGEGETYCYERLRANFVGPKINGVVLLRIDNADAGAPLMKIEALKQAFTCRDLEEPWAFTGNETTFYR